MINQESSPQLLGAARILVFGLWIVMVWTHHIEDFGPLPDDLFEPYGVLRLIPSPLWEAMQSQGFLGGFRLALLLPLAWLVLGLDPFRPVALATCVAITVFDGMGKSVGHINHGQLAMLYAAYVLAWFPCNDGLSLSRRRPGPRDPAQYAAPMMAIAVLMTLTYSFVGAVRLDKSGLGIFASDAMAGYILQRALEPNGFGFTVGVEIVRVPLLAFAVNAGFAFVTLLELTSPLLLFSRLYRRLWLVVMVPFHLLSLPLLNLIFWENLLMMGLFLTDAGRLLSRGAPGRPREAEPAIETA